MAAVEPPWKRLKSTSKAPASPTPAAASRPRVNIKPVIDLVQETVEWPSEPVPEVTIDPCCKHYRDLARSTEKVNLTLSRRGATEVVGEALVDSPAEPTKEDAGCKDPDAVSTIICTLRRHRDPRSIITTSDGTSEVVAVGEEYRGTYGHLRDRKASSTVIVGDCNSEQQEASASVAESDSGRDAAMTPREKSDGDQRSVKSPSPARSPSQAPSAPWMRAAQAAAASLAWFGKGKGMPFMGPAAFARMAAMNRMRAAQAYQEQRPQQGEQTETLPSMEEAARHQPTITQPAVPMDPPRAVPPAIPGLQYQPPRPATQNLSEGFVPPQPPMAAPPFQGGGAFPSGGPPPSEPPRPPPAGMIAGQQQLPNLPPQQPPMPMPPWPPRGPSYGPWGDVPLRSSVSSLHHLTSFLRARTSASAYPHVTEPSAPGYEPYHHDQRWEDSEGGASEHQAFYGYRATADDYNSEYSWSQRGASSNYDSAEERYERTHTASDSSGSRRASQSADIPPEAAIRALLYHGACYTMWCIRKAGTWVGIKLCNQVERQLVAKRQNRVARDELSNRLALCIVDGALQQTRRIHDWLAVRNL